MPEVEIQHAQQKQQELDCMSAIVNLFFPGPLPIALNKNS
jgi:hypothetical protein